MHSTEFKKCMVCQYSWATRDSFIGDDAIYAIGYQANIVAVEKGLFLFNHSCGGTLSLPVEAFRDLYAGPMFSRRLNGSDACPGYCLHQSSLRACPKKCECAYVRDILQMLVTSDKRPSEDLG